MSLSNSLRLAVLLGVCGALMGCDAGSEPSSDLSSGAVPQEAVDSAARADDGGRDSRPAVDEPEWTGAAPETSPEESGTEEAGDIEPPEEPSLADQPVQTGPLGGLRPAPVTLPDNYDPSVSWPLVMLLHGYSASGFIQDYYLGISERVDSGGFIFVLPDGTVDSEGKQFWNAVPGCCNWDGSPVDDAGYLVGLLEEAMARYNVDTSRVVLVGHSNGGYMSHRLACDRADLITGIASIAGTSYDDMDTQCAAEAPVSVLQIHGTLDTTVAYDVPFAGVGAEETAAWWSARNDCGPAPEAPSEDYDAMVLGAETEVTLATECASETAVALWKMNGTGHIPIFSDDFIDDVLAFLLEHPRAAP
ncbi:MAG: alpha/beta hydrolase family esterase [Myxococcota bacterium]